MMSYRQYILGEIDIKFSKWSHGVWNINNISNNEKIRRFRSKVVKNIKYKKPIKKKPNKRKNER